MVVKYSSFDYGRKVKAEIVFDGNYVSCVGKSESEALHNLQNKIRPRLVELKEQIRQVEIELGIW